jgi:hypothetical protein
MLHNSSYLKGLADRGRRQPPRLFFLSHMMPRPHEVTSADGGWRVPYGAQSPAAAELFR